MKGQIFMGNGVHSMADSYQLHHKLERALNIISGLQQPPRSTSGEQAACEEAERWMAESDLESLARQIYEALTGNEIQYA